MKLLFRNVLLTRNLTFVLIFSRSFTLGYCLFLHCAFCSFFFIITSMNFGSNLLFRRIRYFWSSVRLGVFAGFHTMVCWIGDAASSTRSWNNTAWGNRSSRTYTWARRVFGNGRFQIFLIIIKFWRFSVFGDRLVWWWFRDAMDLRVLWPENYINFIFYRILPSGFKICALYLKYRWNPVWCTKPSIVHVEKSHGNWTFISCVNLSPVIHLNPPPPHMTSNLASLSHINYSNPGLRFVFGSISTIHTIFFVLALAITLMT